MGLLLDCKKGESIEGLKTFKKMRGISLNKCKIKCSSDVDCKYFNYVEKWVSIFGSPWKKIT